ncbi:barstar family protein [Alkalinema sp. FACHB-956]|uniref:barstar family protein n=1 Tax=Alkalinema sp. FACHB-956 TaxID=2692768 RepID=UPI00168266BC|nr:barstar family protein [Alkalinema sp. FACHB-956]MBD2325694.1 barstar family protein [Alkalinema sp. FACHB-956]
MNTSREVVEIVLSEVNTTDELHAKLSDALGFPDFYGRNWDAFWDSIAGLLEMPRQLRFYGWNKFVERFPEDSHKLKNCLANMIQESPESASEVEYV